MKMLLALLTVILILGCRPCSAQLVNGVAVEGTISCCLKQAEFADEKMHIVRLKLPDTSVNQAVKFPKLKETQWMSNNWISGRSDIVQLGRNGVSRRVMLPPTFAYKISYVTTVTGALFRDGYGTITALDDGIEFLYEDPHSSTVVKERLQGSITYDPTKSRDERVYTLELRFHDESISDSKDSIFSSTITGTIAAKPVEMKAENGVGYRGVSMDMKLTAANATKAQVSNFVNWWVNCIQPSFY